MGERLDNLLTYDFRSTEKVNLLVYQNYGFGDMVQFLRYIPFLSDATAKLGILIKGNFYEPWAEVAAEPPSFKWLIMSQYGSYLDDVIIEGWNTVTADYTHKIEFMDLAQIYPIISPDVWNIKDEKPKCTEQLSVGYCLAGSKGHPDDSYRSINKIYFDKFLNTFESDVNFVNLSQEELQNKYGCFSIQDTVRVIKSLDLIISVDTLVAHLAGYCQVPVFLLHGKIFDKRWVPNNSKHWYPLTKHFHWGNSDEWRKIINNDLTQAFSAWKENRIDRKTRDREG